MLTVPVSGELRRLRADLRGALHPMLDRLRRPTLAAVGFLADASNGTDSAWSPGCDRPTMVQSPGLALRLR
jgi:hypothetical protein